MQIKFLLILHAGKTVSKTRKGKKKIKGGREAEIRARSDAEEFLLL